MSQSKTDTTYRTSRTEGLSTAVIRAVARAEGIDPTDLETPLYEAVDPDALDDLVSLGPADHPSSGVRVEFTYCGYEVQVRGDGTVTLE
jgi:hypothetical protein